MHNFKTNKKWEIQSTHTFASNVLKPIRVIIIGNLFKKASCWELKWMLFVSSTRSRSKNLTQKWTLCFLPGPCKHCVFGYGSNCCECARGEMFTGTLWNPTVDGIFKANLTFTGIQCTSFHGKFMQIASILTGSLLIKASPWELQWACLLISLGSSWSKNLTQFSARPNGIHFVHHLQQGIFVMSY